MAHTPKLSAEQIAEFEKRIAAAQERCDGDALKALYASPEGQDYWLDHTHVLASTFFAKVEDPGHALFYALMITIKLEREIDVERARVRRLEGQVNSLQQRGLLERPSILRRLAGGLCGSVGNGAR